MTNTDKQEAKIRVQKQLWRNGYSVKDVSRFIDYALLVNDDIKVEVKSAEFKHTKRGIEWRLEGVKKGADILAVVLTTPMKDQLIFYAKLTPWNLKKFRRHMQKEDLVLTPDILKSLFTESPAKVLKIKQSKHEKDQNTGGVYKVITHTVSLPKKAYKGIRRTGGLASRATKC